MWPPLAAFALGVWLTAAPAVLGTADPARASFHVAGPLIALVGLVAVFEVTRPLRWLLVPGGAWLGLAPLVLGYGGVDSVVSIATGLALVVLACLPVRRTENFGGGWRALWDPNAAPPAPGDST